VWIDGHPLRTLEGLGRVAAYSDLPHAFEAWDIDRRSLDQERTGSGFDEEPVRFRVEMDSEHDASIYVTRPLARRSTVTTRYRLIAGEPVLRIDYEIDLKEEDTLIKALFATDYKGKDARYGAPFASALRPQLSGPKSTDAMFECPGSRWACITDQNNDDGLAVMTASSYGFGARDGLLHLSLVRSAKVTETGLNKGLRRKQDVASHFDIGTSVVRTAIGRAGVDVVWHEQPAALAESLFNPPLLYAGGTIAPKLRSIECSPGVIPSWVKPAEGHGAPRGSWVLRLHETLGQHGHADIELMDGQSARVVSILEQPAASADYSEGRLTIRPNAFASLLITPSKA